MTTPIPEQVNMPSSDMDYLVERVQKLRDEYKQRLDDLLTEIHEIPMEKLKTDHERESRIHKVGQSAAYSTMISELNNLLYPYEDHRWWS